MKLANGDEVTLTYTLGALVDIENELGLSNLEEIFNDSDHILKNTLTLVRIGVNATIVRDNLIKGTDKPQYTTKQLAALIDRSQMSELMQMVKDAITDSNKQTFELDEPSSKNA